MGGRPSDHEQIDCGRSSGDHDGPPLTMVAKRGLLVRIAREPPPVKTRNQGVRSSAPTGTTCTTAPVVGVWRVPYTQSDVRKLSEWTNRNLPTGTEGGGRLRQKFSVVVVSFRLLWAFPHG